MCVNYHGLWCTCQLDDQDSGKGRCVKEMEFVQRWGVSCVNLLHCSVTKFGYVYGYDLCHWLGVGEHQIILRAFPIHFCYCLPLECIPLDRIVCIPQLIKIFTDLGYHLLSFCRIFFNQIAL